jgi:small ubiquitin-related modifier
MLEEKNIVEHLNLKVVDQEGGEAFMKLGHFTPLGRLMKEYAERQGKDLATHRFFYEGERIKSHQTPSEVTECFSPFFR